MNALARNLRYVPSAFSHLLLNKGIVSRSAAFKSELKIQWFRPPKIHSTKPEKSGDGGLTLPITPKDTAIYFDKSKELEDADELVKKMFTLEFLPRRATRDKKRELTMAIVKRHQLDRGSMEARLAAMTSEIHHLQEHVSVHPKERKGVILLKELIDKRKKFLKYLRRWDYKRFEWILEKLNLIFKPNPSLHEPAVRKRSMRMLTKIHCNKIKRDKMMALMKKHLEEQPSFFIEKAQKLEFIRNEEIACGREPTVTEEEIACAKDVAEKYKNGARPRMVEGKFVLM